MKSILVVILSASLLLEGCYSSAAVTEEEGRRLLLDSSASISVSLYDGAELEIEPYHYIELTDPSDVVFGLGEKFDKVKGEYEPFPRIIHPPIVRSSSSEVMVRWARRLRL